MRLFIGTQGSGAAPSRPVEALLRQAVRLCILRMKADLRSEASLIMMDDAGIRKLNHDFRGMDQPTDVLSFAANEIQTPGVSPLGFGAGESAYIGDVAVSTERAAEQAEAYGHSYERELIFLTIHGVLHLLGLDHETDGERLHMEKIQRQILKALRGMNNR